MRFSVASERLLRDHLGLDFLIIGDASRRGEKHCIKQVHLITLRGLCQLFFSAILKKLPQFRKFLPHNSLFASAGS